MLAATPFFAPCRRVLVHGLVTKPELNGLGGWVRPPGISSGGSRVPVMMIGGSPRKIKVHPANLRLVPYYGVSYDYDAIAEWLQNKQTDPSTNQPLSVDQLCPNRTGPCA